MPTESTDALPEQEAEATDALSYLDRGKCRSAQAEGVYSQSARLCSKASSADSERPLQI